MIWISRVDRNKVPFVSHNPKRFQIDLQPLLVITIKTRQLGISIDGTLQKDVLCALVNFELNKKLFDSTSLVW